MDNDTTLIDLQKRQFEHDKGYHQDIFNISYPDRMNHYTLHFSKYVGRLSKEKHDKKERRRLLEKTLADSIIVGLAASNTLNLDVGEKFNDEFDTTSNRIEEVAEELNQSSEDTRNITQHRDWLFSNMAEPAGQMSNAMESLDHMEPMNVRKILEEETVQILSYLLIASNKIEADVMTLLDNRWEEIEESSIL